MYITRVFIHATFVCAVVAVLRCPNCCTFKTKAENEAQTIEFPIARETMEIWYQSSDSGVTAYGDLIPTGCEKDILNRNCRNNKVIWTANETGVWKQRTLKLENTFLKYVQIWSDGPTEWSTCNPNFPAMDVGLVTAGVFNVLQLMIICGLICYIIWARKRYIVVEGKLKAALARQEVPLQVIQKPPNFEESEYCEWNESYVRKCPVLPPVPPPVCRFDPPKPASSRETVNSLYGTNVVQ